MNDSIRQSSGGNAAVVQELQTYTKDTTGAAPPVVEPAGSAHQALQKEKRRALRLVRGCRTTAQRWKIIAPWFTPGRGSQELANPTNEGLTPRRSFKKKHWENLGGNFGATFHEERLPIRKLGDGNGTANFQHAHSPCFEARPALVSCKKHTRGLRSCKKHTVTLAEWCPRRVSPHEPNRRAKQAMRSSGRRGSTTGSSKRKETKHPWLVFCFFGVRECGNNVLLCCRVP